MELRHSRGNDEGRPFDNPNNFSDAFRVAQPALAWLYDSMNDVNVQVGNLGLKRHFLRLQEQGAVTPTALRAAFGGPLLFLITECDSAVHWECVEQCASQCSSSAEGPTIVHCLSGDLRHAPNIEDHEQYNLALLKFLDGELAR